jgi:DNA-binding MarR family transcriptional regulator
VIESSDHRPPANPTGSVTSMSPVPAGSALAALEHEIAVFLRRARGAAGALARDVHPDVDAAAYGLMMGIEALGQARVSDLARYFSVGRPTVSRQVTLLEQLQLVRRSRSEADGRSSDLTLTDQGRALLAAARAARLETLGSQLSGWAAADVEKLAGLLSALNRALGP